MPVKYKDIDCLANATDPIFNTYYNESQDIIPWISNKKFAYYCIYFGIVMVFLLVVKYIYFKYIDYSRRNDCLDNIKRPRSKILLKLIAFSRFISYKRIPLIFSRISGLPASVGALLVIFVSTLYVLLLVFVPHFWYRGCLGFGSPPLAVRAGLMTLGVLPFLMIISGKTNFISFVTGISYEKLNFYHQILGWLTFILSMVHVIPFLIQPTKEGGLSELKYQFWNGGNNYEYINGIPPLVCLFILCVLSTQTFRNRFYEIYIHSHWILGLGFVSTLTWHAWGAMYSQGFIWPTLAFWGLQLVYRAIFKTTFKPNSYSFKSKKVNLKVLPNDIFEAVLNIDVLNDEFYWKPGQHIFVRFVHGIHTLDNHPFSIVSLPEINNHKSELKLLIKPHGGLTRKLYDLIQDEKIQTFNVYIDGPYGGVPRDTLAFDKLILISSGSGITATFPFLTDSIENLYNASNSLKKVELIWVINDVESLEWIKPELLKLLDKVDDLQLLKEFVSFDVFVTNSKNGQNSEKVSSKNLASNNSELKELENSKHYHTDNKYSLNQIINIHFGQKPQLSNYLTSLEHQSKNIFIVSGSSSLQNDCGAAISQLQKLVLSNDKFEEFYLHTENFGW
ncbi:hypothetical protein WICMUC_003925 [Wickerhamomyces mucosus]|uniref:ferric-chelate reductase (NADPH) n=1 Tax=Wickerhamomyces mucosus TaxID=1378264 RepID=A0A9P8PKP5_9ASCO|nr:hypothetical protein WICMUC_003925 [Wickerhamomyces mucosus]